MFKLADYFYKNVIENKGKIAILCEGEQMTYEQLAGLTSQYANLLLNNGVRYGEHVGVTINNSINSIALIMAAANNGIGLVPINPTLPVKSIMDAFEVADVKHIIATKRFYEKNAEIQIEGTAFCIDAMLDDKVSMVNCDNVSKIRPIVPEVTGKESFIITMTSGSTGNPKPILLTQENKYHRILAHLRLYNITAEDRILAATPLYHSLAERLVLIPLIIGGTSVLMSRFTPQRWIDVILNEKVTFTIAVSAQLNQIANYLDNTALDSLRCLVSSSALLERHVREKLLASLTCDFHEMYGTSETSTATSINFKETLLKLNSVGKPLKEAEIKILTNENEFADPYEVGEIVCKSTLICEGYYKKDSLFEDSLYKGYFKTGDLGYLDEDGYLYYSGRKKELIITGGINVYPKDIDDCVSKIPEVEECAAFSYPNERLGELVAIAIVLKEHKALSTREIQRYCAKNLADYQQPQKIFFVSKLPKNAMGKLMRTNIFDSLKRGELNEC